MVTCPRCASVVDETSRTTCPICFTPLQGAAEQTAPPPAEPTDPTQAMQPTGLGQPIPPAAPNYAPPAQPTVGMPPAAPRAGRRVSLTGEVIDDTLPDPNAGQPLRPGSYAGGTLGGPPPLPPRAGAPGAPAPSRAAYPPRRAETPAPSRSGGALTAIIVVLVLALGGVGGWWFMGHRTNPKDQALKYMTATKAMDWKALYDTVEIPDNKKAEYPDAQTFDTKVKDQISKTPGAEGFLKTILDSITDVKAGEPTYTDSSTATVPLTFTVSFLGQTKTQTQNVTLHNVGGVWKVSGQNMGGFGGGLMGGASGGGMGGGMPGAQ